ncbi:MAG: hypothetical protein KIT69_12990, partial [Propionibacteriaceae bacterium]|nr:hypothetical protein [Propionibacteriaceae bacterium]
GFLVLAGILVVQRWQAPRTSLPPLLAGALFGAAVTIKLWGIVGVLVLVVWLWGHHGPRRAALAAAGAALAAGQLMLPFATVLPQFVQWSVIDQLGRTRSREAVVNRLVDIVGLGPVPQPAVLPLLVVALALAVIALRIAFSAPEGRLHGGLVLGGVAVLLAAPTWYPHYPALVAGPLCLVFGNAVAAFLSRLPRPGVRLVLTSLAAGLAAAQLLLFSQSVGHRFPGRELAAALQPRPGCATTDRPAALVLSDMLRRNLARDCPVVVDPLGYKFAAQRAGGDPEEGARRFSRFLTDYLGSGSSAVLVTVRPDDLGPENAERIASWPVVGSAGRYLVRAPIPAAPARAWEEVLDSIHPQTQARYP